MQHGKIFLGVLAITVGILIPGCNNDGDSVAPEGSQIFVSATPTTVVLVDPCQDRGTLLPGVDSCGTSEVVATVVSISGFPLKDQDVRFTATAGVLFSIRSRHFFDPLRHHEVLECAVQRSRA